MKLDPKQHVSAFESDSFIPTVPAFGSVICDVDVDAIRWLVRTLETKAGTSAFQYGS